MEKIININLGGRVIAIEDAAYATLKAYFESLNRYFAAEEGREEIINDIESRVAELMEDKIRRGSSAITEAEVQVIISGMGRVEDFEAEEGTMEGGPTAAAPQPRRSKRFYRDENDKIAGGVCSGLAAYLNVDPALIRVVFAILTLGGWGTGVLLYIILWIFVPTKPLEGFHGRRLFRSADDKWLGGVCSGLGAYFDKEAWIFRLGFAAPMLLSLITNGARWYFIPHTSIFFGSITGTFVLIYIVLWVVLPVARSPFEKMEMRGEKVDLNSIRQNVAANMGDIKTRVQDWGSEAAQSASDFVQTRGKAFGREVGAAARPIASRGGEVIGTLFKAIFFFIGITVAFTLFMVLIGYSFGGFADVANKFILQSAQMRTLGWVTVILTLGIPLVALVTLMVRRALHIRSRNKYLGIGFSLLWTAGIICGIFLISNIAREFSRKDYVTEEAPIAQPRSGKLVVRVPESEIEYSNSLPWLHGNIEGWDVSGDSMRSASVGVNTRLSPDSLYHVIITRASRGWNSKAAKARAERIEYTAQNHFGTDSILNLANGYVITKDQGYRGQRVDVEIQVPAGKRIMFDASVDDKLHKAHMVHSWRKNKDFEWDFDDHYFQQDWNSNTEYIMTPTGKLYDPLHPRDTLGGTHHSVEYSYDNGRVRYRHRRHRDREAEIDRRADSIDRAMESRDREQDYRMDSLDRAIEAIERERERIEANRDR